MAQAFLPVPTLLYLVTPHSQEWPSDVRFSAHCQRCARILSAQLRTVCANSRITSASVFPELFKT